MGSSLFERDRSLIPPEDVEDTTAHITEFLRDKIHEPAEWIEYNPKVPGTERLVGVAEQIIDEDAKRHPVQLPLSDARIIQQAFVIQQMRYIQIIEKGPQLGSAAYESAVAEIKETSWFSRMRMEFDKQIESITDPVMEPSVQLNHADIALIAEVSLGAVEPTPQTEESRKAGALFIDATNTLMGRFTGQKGRRNSELDQRINHLRRSYSQKLV